MKLKVINIEHHRNGIGGAPFDVVLFVREDEDPESRMVGILFEQECHCAVLDVAKLAAGDIAFGSNSWRGDRYEPHLRKAIAKSSTQNLQPQRTPIMTAKLPPDPENMNNARAAWAGKALAIFIQETGTDQEDALCDLLADLMHWCDRHNNDFSAALDRARAHYDAETLSLECEP